MQKKGTKWTTDLQCQLGLKWGVQEQRRVHWCEGPRRATLQKGRGKAGAGEVLTGGGGIHFCSGGGAESASLGPNSPLLLSGPRQRGGECLPEEKKVRKILNWCSGPHCTLKGPQWKLELSAV